LDLFYGGAAGGGKILSNEGVVLTPFGWKKGKDLKVGDLINNPDGAVQRIIQIKPEVTLEKWKVIFSDGTSTDVAEDHLWLSWKGGKSRKIGNKRKFGIESAEVVETKELLEWLKRGYNPQIPVCKAQPFNVTSKEIDKIDPYLMGVLLGDGCLTLSNINITCSEEDKNHYYNEFGNDNVTYKSRKTVRFIGNKNKHLKDKLKLHKLYKKKSNNKFIPRIYKFSSIQDRFSLIQGLMDTDGYSAPDKKGCYYYTISKQLSDDVAFVLRSLGAVVTITKDIGSYKDENGNKIICSDCYNLYIKYPNPNDLFRMKRKKKGNFGNKNISKRIVGIEINDEITGRCITVSNPNGLYITNDFIVTHNSIALLMGALQYVDYPEYRALLIRDTYVNLSMPGALMDEADKLLRDKDCLYIAKDKAWHFPSGAVLRFGSLDRPNDHLNYKGSEFHYIGIDEASDLRWKQILYLFSRLRKKRNCKTPLRFRLASNPGGRCHQQLKNRYIYKSVNSEKKFISARLTDNPFIDQDSYLKSLEELDYITRAQLKDGNWDITSEGKLFKRHWFNVIDIMPEDRIKTIRYWDLAATEDNGTEPAWTCGVKISKCKDNRFYVEDVVRFRGSPATVERTIKATAYQDGQGVDVYMEQEPGSGGKNTIDNYSRNILPGFRFNGDKPTGSKVERARSLSSSLEHGNLLLVRANWNDTFIDEFEYFPDSEFKDQVDATAGAYNKLALKGSGLRVRMVGRK
jgi:predicted phage terminase large subunit-like protein